MYRFFIGTIFLLLFGNCATLTKVASSINLTVGDTPIAVNLNYDRTEFGKSPLPFWFQLTPSELQTLQQLDDAKHGDARALLSLALFASGDVRDTTNFNRYHRVVSTFIERITPELDTCNNFWQKGFTLYKHMRDEFFLPDSAGVLGGYKWGQSQVSTIFKKGTYNCISSSILYCILARYFNITAQGVLTQSLDHAFVQITDNNGKIIEVETTAKNGYDWIHNEQFYKEQAAGWFRSRDLELSSFEDYINRAIVEPYQLICHNMQNQHTRRLRMAIEDIYRLKECQAFIDADNIEYQRERLKIYNAEFDHLKSKKAYAIIERFFTTVSPIVTTALETFPKDSTIAVVGVNLLVNQQGQLQKQNDYENFITLSRKLLSVMESDTVKFGPVFSNCLTNVFVYIKQQTEGEQFAEAESLADMVVPYSPAHEWLIQNLQWALGTAMTHYWNNNNWEEVIRIGRKQKAIDVHGTSKRTIESNLEGAYCNWASTYMDEGDWPKAREVLKKCVSEFSGKQTKCTTMLQELEASHTF